MNFEAFSKYRIIQYFWELWNKGAQDKKIKTFQKTKIFNYGVFIQTRK